MYIIFPTLFIIVFTPDIFSVAVPFVGDNVGLNSNPNWEKVKMKQEESIALNLVENVFKLNRANAKVCGCFIFQKKLSQIN